MLLCAALCSKLLKTNPFFGTQTCIGVIVPMLMADPKKMVRTDGTRVVTTMQPSWKAEIYGLYVALRNDPWIILLFPMFFASNYFYTWRE